MKYRKNAVVIAVIQFTGFNFDEIEAFVGGDYGKDPNGQSVIATREGPLSISSGDFIIKLKGKFYSISPNIFTATFKAVTPHGEGPTDV